MCAPCAHGSKLNRRIVFRLIHGTFNAWPIWRPSISFFVFSLHLTCSSSPPSFHPAVHIVYSMKLQKLFRKNRFNAMEHFCWVEVFPYRFTTYIQFRPSFCERAYSEVSFLCRIKNGFCMQKQTLLFWPSLIQNSVYGNLQTHSHWAKFWYMRRNVDGMPYENWERLLGSENTFSWSIEYTETIQQWNLTLNNGNARNWSKHIHTAGMFEWGAFKMAVDFSLVQLLDVLGAYFFQCISELDKLKLCHLYQKCKRLDC